MTKPPEEVMYAMRRALVSFDATYNPQTPDERIRSILAAAEQAGWVLVPAQATGDMICAGGETQQVCIGSWGEPKVVWNAMSAAAPKVGE